MHRIKIMGLAFVAALAIVGLGATSASAKSLEIYEPLNGDPSLPYAVAFRDPLDQTQSLGGFAFFVGGRQSAFVNVAECAGVLSGILETDFQREDRFSLTSASVGANDTCPAAGPSKGFTQITISGFPLGLTISDTGHVRVTGTLVITIEDAEGLPSPCVYSGPVKQHYHVVGLNEALVLKLEGVLKSKAKSCQVLDFTAANADELSEGLKAFGAAFAAEALYTSVE